MDRHSLRLPFYLGAVLLFAAAVAIELGSVLDFPSLAKSPPGRGIQAIALLDGLVLATVVILGAGFLLSSSILGRIQGLLMLVVSLLDLLGSIAAAFGAFSLLLVMVGLFVAAPFGTIAYLALWGDFPRPLAAGILSLVMALKMAAAACLILAQQRLLENKALVAIILSSLLCGLVISFLHRLVPGELVSITDMLGTLIVAVISAIWALILLVLSVPGVFKALRVRAG